ncbi:MAG: hypothetical protein ABSB32_17280 [Thermodesulfobacteriota bacterium]
MSITPAAVQNVTPQVAPAVRKQHAKPVEAPAQPPKKDTVVLSQRAKDLAAQMSGKTVQEEAKESPGIETQEEQAQQVLKAK